MTNRFLLVEQTYTSPGGAKDTGPVLVNLDHVRTIHRLPNGKARLWWVDGQNPTDLTCTFDELLTHINHADLEEGP